MPKHLADRDAKVFILPANGHSIQVKLLIISHTPHYTRDERLVGWGATVREIDQLATLFNPVVHIAPLYSGEAPESALPYEMENVSLCPVAPAGGESFSSKLGLIKQVPAYLNSILRELRTADLVHVRCPANISLLALLILILIRWPKYRWVKYAGNWQPKGKDALSYAIQRWILRANAHQGVVTVNGRWEGQPVHIYAFHNPCLNPSEITNAKQIAHQKSLQPPYQLLYVGRLETAKGVGRIIRLARLLKTKGIPFECTLIGDGPERAAFERQADQAGLAENIHFLGWLPRTDLGEYYARAHYMLLPSTSSEGWPKVLSEAMAYGAMVLASDVSSIPQTLADTGAGVAIPAEDIARYCQVIQETVDHPEMWSHYSQAGARAADRFTYADYLEAVQGMAKQAWGISINGKQ